MPPNTSFASTMPDDILWDSGILYHNSSTTPFAASTGGGFKFDPGYSFQNLASDVDGVFYPVQGLDRNVGGVPKLTGTVVALTQAMMAQLEPGSSASAADVNGTVTVTPKAAGDLLGTSNYLVDVRAVWRRGNGTYFAVAFRSGLVTKYDISGSEKEKGAIALEIEARQLPADVAAGVVPYKLFFGTSIAIGELA